MADTTLVPGIASGIAIHWHTPDRPHTPIHRLIVLLPDTDMNEVAFARVLWMLAGHNGSRVRLIAKVEDWANRGLVEVRVALLESFLREANIELSTVFDDSTNDWVQIVRHEYLPGDAIVCHAEQKLPVRALGFGIEVSSLSHHLATLHMPVCELQGILIGLQKMTFVRVLKVWVAPLLIIVGSLVLEVFFFSWARNWAEWARNAVLAVYTALEILSVAWLARK